MDHPRKSRTLLPRLLCRYILLLCALCSGRLVHAQQQYGLLFHQSYVVRSAAFDTLFMQQLVKLKPAMFTRQLNTLLQRARKEHDRGAELELTLGRFRYEEEHRLVQYDRKTDELERLLKSVDEQQFPEYAALIMFDLGNNYFGKKHNYVAAFDNYINACNLAGRFSSAAFPDKKNILVGVGNRYYSIGDLDKARDILLEADSLPPFRQPVVNYNNQNTLGLISRSYKKYDEAVRYFQKTKALAEKDGDSVWAAIATGNIGISYYQNGNYKQAIPLLRNDIANCLILGTNAVDNGVNSLLILTDIHLKMDSMDVAAQDIGLLRYYINYCRDRVKPLSMFYPVLARYYARKGDFRSAFHYQDTADVYKDSLTQRDDIFKLAKLEHRKELEKHETELKRLHTQKKLVEVSRNALLISIVLISIITVLVVSRQRLRHRMRQNMLMNRNELAEQELQNASRQLEHYTKHLQEKNTLIERSGHEIERLQTLLRNRQQEDVNNDVLQQIYTSTILTDDEWNEFKLLFEQVHKGYLQRLKDKMPELTPADTKFIVLSKLKMTNKEMAGILGVQPDTIRSYKHRLRKRFGLSEDAGIMEFVDAI